MLICMYGLVEEPEVLDEHASKTWVHRLFEGVLTNETRCLTCETVSSLFVDVFCMSVLLIFWHDLRSHRATKPS